MSSKRFALIPAGGAGTRLWPRSRRSTPKHALPLAEHGRPLLRDTYDRARGLVDEIFVVTERTQRAVIQTVLPEIDERHLILEPVARGTTNAYGLAAVTLAGLDPDAVVISMAADHAVRGKAEVSRAIRAGLNAAAETDSIILLGLKPRFASTGLGYIRARRPGPAGTRWVEEFIEKPNLATARRFLKSGSYYWNLAWFSWRPRVMMDEIGRHLPRRLAALEGVVAARNKGDEERAGRLYARLPVDVIDRTVLEKTDNLLRIPARFEWSDIGSWAELGDRVHADARGNSVEGEAVLVDTTGSLVFGDRRLIAAIGLEDMIIVDSEDAVLVVPRSRAQDVRKVVEALKRSRKTRYL